MGVISTKKSLVQLEQLPVAAFCRRRLAVVAVRLKMAQSIKEAATYIEQGHIRVGPGDLSAVCALCLGNVTGLGQHEDAAHRDSSSLSA